MASAVFKTVCVGLSARWVGSIPTRFRHREYEASEECILGAFLLHLQGVNSNPDLGKGCWQLLKAAVTGRRSVPRN